MGEGESQRKADATHRRQRVFHVGLAAIEVANHRMGPSGIDGADDPGQFAVLEQTGLDRQTGAASDASVEGIERLSELAEAETGAAQRAPGEPLRLGRGVVDRQRAQPLGDHLGIDEIRAIVDAVPQAAQRLELLHGLANALGELDGPSKGRLDLGRGIAVQRDARHADQCQRLQLQRGSLGPLGQAGDQAQGAIEVVDRLAVGVARDRRRRRRAAGNRPPCGRGHPVRRGGQSARAVAAARLLPGAR